MNSSQHDHHIKGFTLIELVVTIAVLAIIISIVAVAVNPAEQLARARDAKRVSDLSAMNTAWNLYVAESVASIPDLSGHATYTCKDEAGSNGAYFMSRSTGTSTPTGFDVVATSTVQTVGATGWAPARIDAGAGGSDLAQLPIDPLGGAITDPYWYAYACDQTNKKYEFTARLESTFFSSEIQSAAKDGGNSTSTFEIGTDLTIIPGGY